ncbi:MAG: FHA domain-containing protein [Bacteroidaceae bacterium]|nr:FHA domain-containing protein [Bacteroidaceae bacterium]
MKTYIEIEGKQVDLEAHLSKARTIVTLGKNTEDAYNVLALDEDSVEVFQCQFTRTAEGNWKIQNGQWRTECPKGIRSRLQHACNLCMGRCVNSRPAHPTYSWRDPKNSTLLNGVELNHEGMELKDGDVIAMGHLHLSVRQS